MLPRPHPGRPRSKHAPRVAVVVSRYNATVTDRLLAGAVAECVTRTGAEPIVYSAAGAFELPSIANAAAESGRFDAIVALGCIIRGETSHDRYLAQAVTDGIMSVALRTGVPVSLGVLTVETSDQAEARAGGAHGNKGQEAMGAAIECAEEVRAARTGRTSARAAGAALPRPDKTLGRSKR